MHQTELDRIPAEEVIVLRPLDNEIIGGVALGGCMCDDDVLQVLDRLQESFDSIRTAPWRAKIAVEGTNRKPQTEFGECVAYSVPALDDSTIVDSLLLDLALQQNHGLKTNEPKFTDRPDVEILWNGNDCASKQEIILYKRTGRLVMSDYMPHVGTIYALKSKVLRPETPKAAWGWM